MRLIQYVRTAGLPCGVCSVCRGNEPGDPGDDGIWALDSRRSSLIRNRAHVLSTSFTALDNLTTSSQRGFSGEWA